MCFIVKAAGGQKKMFLICFKGNFISWYPDTSNNTPSWNDHFIDLMDKLIKQIDIKEFDIKMPILFDANHENNKNLMCNSTSNNNNHSIMKYCNILNCNTIEYFWNLLCDKTDISVMNFIIGIDGISGKKAIIVSPQSLHGVNKCLINYFVFDFHNSSTMTIENDRKKDGDAEPDWNEYFRQLVSFLNVVTRNNNDDTNSHSEDLLFRIHPFTEKPAMNKTSNLSQIMKVSDDKVRINDQVKNGDDFEKCFVAGGGSSDAKSECYLFVENKHYFILKMDDIEHEWHPQQQQQQGFENSWDNEYNKLVTFICDKFGLINDEHLHLKFLENDSHDDENNHEIQNGDDIEMMWDELVHDSERRADIIVSGLPLPESKSNKNKHVQVEENIVDQKMSELQSGNDNMRSKADSNVKPKLGESALVTMVISFENQITMAIKDEKFSEIERARAELTEQMIGFSCDVSKRASYINCHDQIQFRDKITKMIAKLNFNISALNNSNLCQVMETDEILKLADLFSSVDTAVRIGKAFLSADQYNHVIRLQNASKKLLEGWIDGLVHYIEQLIDCHEYEDAESRIAHILGMWPIVSGLTTHEYEEKMDRSKEFERETWRNKILNHCNGLIDKYKTLKLNKRGYASEKYSLKNLNNKIERVLKCNECYRDLWHETWQDFQEKFDQALNEAQKSGTEQEEDKLLSQCRYVINFTPDENHDPLTDQLDECKESIDKSEESFTDTFDKLKKAKILEPWQKHGVKHNVKEISVKVIELRNL